MDEQMHVWMDTWTACVDEQMHVWMKRMHGRHVNEWMDGMHEQHGCMHGRHTWMNGIDTH